MMDDDDDDARPFDPVCARLARLGSKMAQMKRRRWRRQRRRTRCRHVSVQVQRSAINAAREPAATTTVFTAPPPLPTAFGPTLPAPVVASTDSTTSLATPEPTSSQIDSVLQQLATTVTTNHSENRSVMIQLLA